MLRIRGLKKRYKTLTVLNELDMNIDKGDVYGLLGTNGCGKTTTMNIICNIIPKDDGVVEFENDNLKIGYLPETPSLYGYLNGFEYLDYIGACCRYEGDIKTRTAEVLEITGMTKMATRLIRGYSKGMNQRIGIAAALYSKPDLLILDEPTSALDPAGRAGVIDIIERLAVTGATIILCTHILGDVERVANKIGILKNGKMTVEGSIREVREWLGNENVLNIRFRQHSAEAINALCGNEIVSRHEVSDPSGITLYAKEGVSEKEMFNMVVSSLLENEITPESIEFRRMSLEDMYLKITGAAQTK